jgi:hypothetical protein
MPKVVERPSTRSPGECPILDGRLRARPFAIVPTDVTSTAAATTAEATAVPLAVLMTPTTGMLMLLLRLDSIEKLVDRERA